jgi:hypothetical protein
MILDEAGTHSGRMTPVEVVHELPPGVAARLYRAAYGRYLAVVRTPAGEFTAGGESDYLALSRALRKSERGTP